MFKLSTHHPRVRAYAAVIGVVILAACGTAQPWKSWMTATWSCQINSAGGSGTVNITIANGSWTSTSKNVSFGDIGDNQGSLGDGTWKVADGAMTIASADGTSEVVLQGVPDLAQTVSGETIKGQMIRDGEAIADIVFVADGDRVTITEKSPDSRAVNATTTCGRQS